MRDGSVTTRTVEPADTGEIVELMARALGSGRVPRTEAFFRWKHFSNPFGESPMRIAMSGNDAVGFRAFLQWQFERRGQRFVGLRPVDTVTSENFRGRGIFRRLTMEVLESTENGASIVFNTPNDKSRPGYLKMGWAEVGRSSLWARPRAHLVPRFLGAKPAEPSLPAGSVHELLESSILGHVLRGDATRRYHRLHTCRSPEYVRWRYADIPGLAYGARFSKDQVAVVYGVRRRGRANELTIVEVLMPSTARSGFALARLLRELVRDAACDYALAAAPACRWEATGLAGAGFLPVPTSGPILTALGRGSAAPQDVLSLSSWSLSIGDLELF